MEHDTVVDFSRVDTALRLVERERKLASDREHAAIAKVRAGATAKIIKYGAVACALIILSVGAAIWLAKAGHLIELKQTAFPQEVEQRLPARVAPPSEATVFANKIKTNVTQFNSIEARDLKFSNRFLVELTAGHAFASSNADRWESAWCYARFWREGLTYTVTLENRDHDRSAPRTATESERQRLELSETDVLSLRTLCPWKQR
jgi:hypothetical protein